MIKMLNKNTREVIQEFDSAAAAARFLQVEGSGIRRCLRGEQHVAHGYQWSEADNENRVRARRTIELRGRLESMDLGIGVAPISESDIL